ncbi:MAG: class I SAM-dependent methyltransferase [Deltaproteobacteria bacterium]|nr:class I SAM-dependent methyltransferase [Deltaproteobacteria bacterium]
MERKTRNITEQFQQEYFRTRFVFDPRREPVWRAVAEFIQKHWIAKDARVLDLGAGYCDFINHIEAKERHALDIFQRLPEFAGPGVRAHIGSCVDMSRFGDASFDVIFASNLFEHLTHDQMLTTLDEARRVLRLDGRLILMQPNFKYCYRTYFDDYTHLQVFTHEGMYDLLEMAGLQIESIDPRFLPVNMKTTLKLRLPALHTLVAMYLRSPIRPLAAQMLVVARNHSPNVAK